ncbi:DUF1793-domain-containing protein [Umbelopsis sp. AD052]|nr:DUF1793-domain-containing protein [Umbelopsis sp. AD052]
MGMLKSSVLLTVSTMAVSCAALAQYASTIRGPSYPLAVRQPYVSTWLPADSLSGNWPTFWTGAVKGWEGMIRVDGTTYEWMGAASGGGSPPVSHVAKQNSVTTTPTQTVFSLTAGPVNVNVTFLSPVEYDDIKRQSIPLSYVFVTAEANDGKSHAVQVYSDITGEWATGDLSQVVTWNISNSNGMKTWTIERESPIPFGESNDYPNWGQAVYVTSESATYASGADVDIRSSFVKAGKLNNTNDNNFRCAQCSWPVVGFAYDLGNVTKASKPVQFVVGHVREQNVQILNDPQDALWKTYWKDASSMIKFFWNDAATSQSHSNTIDSKLLNDAYKAQGQAYADVISFTLRQAMGATEFGGNKSSPVLYLKEISSDGNMQTVDIMFPASPMFYYLNADLLKYLMEPLFYQMENGNWPKVFSIHDIGSHYPNATGHPDGNEEDMPVEESADMIFMVANYMFNPSTKKADAKAYGSQHYKILSSWANYLYGNCLYPTNQLTTDDFIGQTQLNSGLALKGILAMKAFSNIAGIVGNKNETAFYSNASASYIKTWVTESQSADKSHLKLEYNVTDGYELKYNAFQDKLLKLNTVPESIYTEEANYYLTKDGPYGMPFVSTHDYTKSDWEVWTAAAFGDANPVLRKNIIEDLSKFLQTTSSRVPFSDWYNTTSAETEGFKARPAVGGHFALLALDLPASS